MEGIGAFRVFMRTRLNIEPLKPTKVEPKILQLSIKWHKLSSELGRRLGPEVGFKELRL